MDMVPDQIRRQAAEVAKYDEALLARERGQTDVEVAAESDTKPEPEAEMVQEQVSEAPVQQAPQAREDDSEDKWRRRYESLRGKYDAEVSPLHQQNRELQQKLEAVERKLQELTQRTQEPERKPASQLVTPQDVENFGSELIDLIERKATEVFSQSANTFLQKISELESENARLRESVTSVERRQGQSQQQIFMQQLTEMVPDWKSLNTDPGFLNWLTAVDPLSGVTRQALLDAAAGVFDVGRTAAVFNAYKREAGIGQPTPQPQSQTPQRAPKNPEISAQVTPGRSKSSSPTPPADPNQKIWSTQEIEQFYRDCTRGRYRPEDQARIQAEIDSAAAQGRIR